jgi:hypothetical protein
LVKCQIQDSAEAGEIIVDIVLDKGGDSWRPMKRLPTTLEGDGLVGTPVPDARRCSASSRVAHNQ